MDDKKFKLTELDAKDSPVKDIEWEGEELQAESTTKIQDDKGTGQELILRFFDFAADRNVFELHKPTAQELFESHRSGMEAMLWTDGLVPCKAIEPRLMFSKDKSYYRFVVSCIPSTGNTILEGTHTLSELLQPNVTTTDSIKI
jgi:hypothetical protein